MQCPDCNGRKIYESFSGVKESCEKCKGTGEVAEVSKSTVVAASDDEDGVIRFSVTSDGTTGPQWIKRLESNGFHLIRYTKDVLRSQDFQPTFGIMTEIAVMRDMLFSDEDRITKNIRQEADRRSLVTPNAEVACLIREKFTDKDLEEMGLCWIVTMHEPIDDSDGDPLLLNAYRDGDGGWLRACYSEPVDGWLHDGVGFAFVASKSKP